MNQLFCRGQLLSDCSLSFLPKKQTCPPCGSCYLWQSKPVQTFQALLTVQSQPWHSSPADPRLHMTVLFAHGAQSKKVHITKAQVAAAYASALASVPTTNASHHPGDVQMASQRGRGSSKRGRGVSQSPYPYAIALLTEPRLIWHRSTSDRSVHLTVAFYTDSRYRTYHIPHPSYDPDADSSRANAYAGHPNFPTAPSQRRRGAWPYRSR